MARTLIPHVNEHNPSIWNNIYDILEQIVANDRKVQIVAFGGPNRLPTDFAPTLSGGVMNESPLGMACRRAASIGLTCLRPRSCVSWAGERARVLRHGDGRGWRSPPARSARSPERRRSCDYADARNQARRMVMACSSFAAGARWNKAEIRPYAADRLLMMASACSSRIRARQIVALGAMMFPDILKLLFGRLLFGASRK